MFDKILDFLLSFFHQIFPLFVVDEFEQSVVLRGGRFNRVCLPGIHWKIPFLDVMITQFTVPTTLTIPAQSLVTKDGKNIVVKSVVKYKIFDVKVFSLEVNEATDAISDVAQGIVKTIVMSSTWDECTDVQIDNEISKKLRHEMKKFGVAVESVILTDIAQIRSLRLINETALNV